jgi:hypothetical protein
VYNTGRACALQPEQRVLTILFQAMPSARHFGACSAKMVRDALLSRLFDERIAAFQMARTRKRPSPARLTLARSRKCSSSKTTSAASKRALRGLQPFSWLLCSLMLAPFARRVVWQAQEDGSSVVSLDDECLRLWSLDQGGSKAKADKPSGKISGLNVSRLLTFASDSAVLRQHCRLAALILTTRSSSCLSTTAQSAAGTSAQ